MKSNVSIINYPSPFLMNIFESTLRMTVALIFKLFSRKKHPVLSFSQSHVNTNAEICTFKPAWFMLIQWNAKNTVKYGEMWLVENWLKEIWLAERSQPGTPILRCFPVLAHSALVWKDCHLSQPVTLLLQTWLNNLRVQHPITHIQDCCKGSWLDDARAHDNKTCPCQTF